MHDRQKVKRIADFICDRVAYKDDNAAGINGVFTETPHKWDKWWVHMTTRSYCRALIKAGVKIYEYAKGFIHSKTFVSDDRVATVGTTNLDFRSLYLHFECGVRMYDGRAVSEVKENFLQTLEICHIIKLEDCKASLPMRIFQDIMRIFAPLM